MKINDFMLLNPQPTYDIVIGDIILFSEPVWSGSYYKGKKSRPSGERKILAEVIDENYGYEKQQHTFSLLVLDADGYESTDVLKKGKILRKGRNIYTDNTLSISNLDEKTREIYAENKHLRGLEAKKAKIERIKNTR